MAEKKLSSEQQSMLEKLQALPKKKILIPEDPLNPNDEVVPVCVNGVLYTIPRGKECEVPDVVYDVWKESYEKTVAANKKIKITELKDMAVSR